MFQKNKQLFIWIGALLLGGALGYLGLPWLNTVADFVATIYTRLFQFVAVPTIALAVVTTLSSLGSQAEAGKLFRKTISYTLLTTFAAGIVALLLYSWVAPGNLPAELFASAETSVASNTEQLSYLDHLISVIPNNIITPFAAGNVLSILLVAFGMGIALAKMPQTENRATLLRVIFGLQELLFTAIRGLIWALPLGIVAFAAQLSAQIEAGVVVGSLGKYVAVILSCNFLQIFVVLPLFLLACGLNPWRTFRAMTPAVLMALFTKSSAATLPVTIQSAEERLGAQPRVARFVLPICTTVNMNGCAAFILVTSLFVMQNGGVVIDLPTMLLWLLIAVFSAIGNAGVPMGCYFLTLSLMAGQGAPISIMGIILPIFTIIDMIETAENVWSDSCVCAIVNKEI
ncbi:MAG: dicarboxylate/amino acid:cation symporter [Bacteroidales bacterium]|nr:dicarboxylate/amino acid:cation symporter [Bacteroidales bacterium]